MSLLRQIIWPPKNLEELLRRAAATLRAAGAREVFVFGSAATGKMHQGSDVDLAVEGLPPRLFFPTMARIGDIFGRPIDLVELDDDTPFTRYLKKKEGLLQRVS